MSTQLLLRSLSYAEIVICIAILCFLTMRRQWREYWALGSFLAVRATAGLSLALIANVYTNAHNMRGAYQIYFSLYWVSFAIESVLAFFIIYGVFGCTIGPLKGLRRAGMVAICVAIAILAGMALVPAAMPHMNGLRYAIQAVTHLQWGQSLLGIGLLLFVCYALRPLGLSWRSKVFGVSLGLGVMAITNLAQSVWVANSATRGVYSLINAVVVCATMAIWAAYFAMQEPVRREIDFYGGSALLRLNRKLVG